MHNNCPCCNGPMGWLIPVGGGGLKLDPLGFTCRECGEDQELRTDTKDYGVLVSGTLRLTRRCKILSEPRPV